MPISAVSRAVRSLPAIACLAVTLLPPPSMVRAEETPNAPAAIDEHVGPPRAVVPPGKEDLLAEMLGRGETLPGECKLTAGDVDHTAVHATYACGAGEVVVELRHPGNAPTGAPSTTQFALLVTRGEAPAGLVDALVARVRAREAGFAWEWTHASEPDSHPNTLVAVACVLVIALVAWAIWRRVRGRSARQS